MYDLLFPRLTPFSLTVSGDKNSPAVMDSKRKNPFSFSRSATANPCDPDIAAQQKKSLVHRPVFLKPTPCWPLTQSRSYQTKLSQFYTYL
jgi:hypothetical protein